MNIKYKLTPNITPEEFINILNNSALGDRRPIDDIKTIKGMIDNADIIITALIDNKIIGVARAVTDFHYCCYLSDLAVDINYQNQGIGKQLINKVQEQLNSNCKIIFCQFSMDGNCKIKQFITSAGQSNCQISI